LLRFGTGQKHTIVERMQEALLADPALFFDKDAMHHRNLTRRTAERQCGDPRPDLHSIAKGDAVVIGPVPVVDDHGYRVFAIHI